MFILKCHVKWSVWQAESGPRVQDSADRDKLRIAAFLLVKYHENKSKSTTGLAVCLETRKTEATPITSEDTTKNRRRCRQYIYTKEEIEAECTQMDFS